MTNIHLLLSYDARVDIKDAIGLTALDLAVRGSHEDCVQALLTAQAVQEASRLSLHHKLSEACLRGDSELLAKLLVREEKYDPRLVLNMSVEGTNTLLFKYDLVNMLVGFLLFIHQLHSIHRAAQLGHRDVVQVLLQFGAEPLVNPVTKYSPLYIACFEGHKDVVEQLLKVSILFCRILCNLITVKSKKTEISRTYSASNCGKMATISCLLSARPLPYT